MGDILTPKDLPAYVRQVAPQYGVDPAAALAMAQHEGIGGNPGDGNTSFGPWQLHVGGALPSNIGALGPVQAQQWAWSADGINYALGAMSKNAKNLTGWNAVSAIAQWERSADIPGQTARAWQSYTGWLGDNIPIALSGFITLLDIFGKKSQQGAGGSTDGGGNAIVPVPNDGIDIPGSTTVPGQTTTSPATGGIAPQDIRLGAVGPFTVGIPSGLILGLLGLCLLLIGALLFGYFGATRINIGAVGGSSYRSGTAIARGIRT